MQERAFNIANLRQSVRKAKTLHYTQHVTFLGLPDPVVLT
jgi:hypothetical protein